MRVEVKTPDSDVSVAVFILGSEPNLAVTYLSINYDASQFISP